VLLGPLAALYNAAAYAGFVANIEPSERSYQLDEIGAYLERGAACSCCAVRRDFDADHTGFERGRDVRVRVDGFPGALRGADVAVDAINRVDEELIRQVLSAEPRD
jgi:hypothetical protein